MQRDDGQGGEAGDEVDDDEIEDRPPAAAARVEPHHRGRRDAGDGQRAGEGELEGRAGDCGRGQRGQDRGGQRDRVDRAGAAAHRNRDQQHCGHHAGPENGRFAHRVARGDERVRHDRRDHEHRSPAPADRPSRGEEDQRGEQVDVRAGDDHEVDDPRTGEFLAQRGIDRAVAAGDHRLRDPVDRRGQRIGEAAVDRAPRIGHRIAPPAQAGMADDLHGMRPADRGYPFTRQVARESALDRGGGFEHRPGAEAVAGLDCDARRGAQEEQRGGFRPLGRDMDRFAADPQLRQAPPVFGVTLGDAGEQDFLFRQRGDPRLGAFLLAGVPVPGQERQRGEGEQHDREAAEPRAVRCLPSGEHAEQRGEGDGRAEHGRPGVGQPQRDAD